METEAERLRAQGLADIETVGDILDRMEGAPPGSGDAAPFIPPRLEGAPAFPPVGVYLGMDEGLYHSIHACSASGIKKLAVSSLDYWACSTLNPDHDDEDTKAKALGRAYHVRVCEGREAYLARYAIELDKADHPGALITMDDIKARLELLGLKGKKSKDESFDFLLEWEPDAVLWDRLVAEHKAANEGRTLIRAIDHRRIEIAAKMIEADPELSKAFSGGHAEVSIFFYDEATGAPCKTRLDYLKLAALVDLKSFSNTFERPVSRAIDFTIASQKHYVGVVFYMKAIAAAKKLVRERGVEVVNGADDPDWWTQWSKQPPPTALWVYQQTGRAPVTRGRVMHSGTVYSATEYVVNFLMRRWRRCAEAFGVEPWVDVQPIERIVDENIPLSATDFGDSE